MPSADVLVAARAIRENLAGGALLPQQAKLYAQRIRLDMGADGLPSFSISDLDARLEEAMLLLETAWIERSAASDGDWQQAVKRAAELLEWISQSDLRPANMPVHLLSAAAFQLAGYPAMALSHLRRMPDDEPFSGLLREFLRGNFDDALEQVKDFWTKQRALEVDRRLAPPIEYEESAVLAELELSTVRHVVMCIGTICAYLRTGDAALVERALVKLDALASGYVHSRDSYSYLLARLSAGAARNFVSASLWPQVNRLAGGSDARARDALIQFARSAFVNNRSLIWPGQRDGIKRLAAADSFVLCTPTGSGKTTVATLGAVQGLFGERRHLLHENLVLYLVPSRALAAEVEARFAQDLQGIAAEPVVVTGLYGGADWGPTDAWVQIDQPTVVICTFEKADALLRYLGTLFLDRVRLVVIDEAHMVELNPDRADDITDGTSRALRLEQLSARLLRAQQDKGFRLIALSAVAAKAAPAIARWLGGGEDSVPITSTYRSTRQMLGKLMVSSRGRFDIQYDLMDGRSLEFEDERRDDKPYVTRPFPDLPGGVDGELGPEKKMRAPTLWAALHLAAQRPDGTTPTVMISLTQSVSAWAETCADLMDSWGDDDDVILPDYWIVDDDDAEWQGCLLAAEDYFTVESFEYRLLSRGIAVHHGQLPALLARRLKTAIDRGNVRVIIATSTLSEGVNIPVSTLLIPSLHRATSVFSVNEFSNLVGRAGRPGVATEGTAFVVLPEREYVGRGATRRPAWNRTWEGYEALTQQIERAATIASAGDIAVEEGEANSPLAMLLTKLREAWEDLSDSNEDDAFVAWLEQTAVIDAEDAGDHSADSDAITLLDSLDGLLIASLQELEQLRGTMLAGADLEAELLAVWRRTYAYVAATEEGRLAKTWLGRGRAITALYPDADRRRQLYKASLPPRSGSVLLDSAEALRTMLQAGGDYADWDTEEQFEFVRGVIAALSQIPAFSISTTLGRKKNFSDWPRVLRWWLSNATLARQPGPKELGPWFGFVASNFIYRGSWGLGSLIGVLLDRGGGVGPVDALSIDDWPRSGLPWIGFWLKELINWGTLDPVAAFLLARGNAVDRKQAETDAAIYYEALDEEVGANDALDPRTIRDWVESRQSAFVRRAEIPDLFIDVRLERPAGDYHAQTLSVMPLASGAGLSWIDPAGYTVARSDLPTNWSITNSAYRFELSVATRVVSGDAYLPHRTG